MAIRDPILQKHFEKIGFDSSFFETYEDKASDKMQNIDEMCDKLHEIYENQNKITIYTDFDVDGIMSSVIAYAGLSELGFDVRLYKPSPSSGYGFHINELDKLLSEYPDTQVLLTGDVGINDNKTIEYAHGRRLTVLVTDHHLSESKCAADIAVNPNQSGETYSQGGICGSYVIYKVIENYCLKYCDKVKQSNIFRLKVFAGIATISDAMPLLYENRELVRQSIGIARYFFGYQINDGSIAPPACSENYSRAFVGLKMLLKYFAHISKIKTTGNIDEQFYGFYLVPFLNSCKRMEGDMTGIYNIFFGNMAEVNDAIAYEEMLNDIRRQLTADELEKILQADENSQPYAHCGVYITDTRPGLCGLLATKLMNISGMPTMVLIENDDGSFSGSGRNSGFMDIVSALADYHIPVTCRGHRDAFGIFAPDKRALAIYADFFENVVLDEYKQVISRGQVIDTNITMTNTSRVVCDFHMDTLDIKAYLAAKENYRPYGQAFPEPYFKLFLDNQGLREEMFGALKQHMRLITSDGVEILLFGQALDYEKLKYDMRDKDYVFVFYGSFRYDNYYEDDYDTICFFADDLDALEC